MSYLLIQADARQIPLADETVDCVVTSPPYYGLRDYGVADQIGLEQAFDCMGWATGESCGACFICQLRAVFREVRRVLKPHGTCWVNMGDSYNSAKSGAVNGIGKAYGKTPDKPGHNRPCRVATGLKTRPLNDLKHKDLMCQPWRLGLALQADGWWLRSDIIWHKPNPIPESATDRPSKAHEYLLLLSKLPKYFYDAHAVREANSEASIKRFGLVEGIGQTKTWNTSNNKRDGQPDGTKSAEPFRSMRTWGRNARTIWKVPSQPRPEAHFATFPEKLAERCILAGTSAKGVCPACGRPWRRLTRDYRHPDRPRRKQSISDTALQKGHGQDGRAGARYCARQDTVGWEPTCQCDSGDPVPAVVLDPFIGSGTTCRVADRLGRRAIGLDLSHAYLHDIATPFLSRPLQKGLGLEAA